MNYNKKQLPKYKDIQPPGSLCGWHDVCHRHNHWCSTKPITWLHLIVRYLWCSVATNLPLTWCGTRGCCPQTTITSKQIDCVLWGREPIFPSVPFRKYCTIYCLVAFLNNQLLPNAHLHQLNLKWHNMLKGCNEILCYIHMIVNTLELFMCSYLCHHITLQVSIWFEYSLGWNL